MEGVELMGGVRRRARGFKGYCSKGDGAVSLLRGCQLMCTEKDFSLY